MAIFDVRDYGATANDSTDDSAAIQAAIDAAFDAGGGTVFIPTGTFMVSGDETNPSAGCIEVRSNVTLTGDGIGATVLKLVDGFDARINGIVRTPVDESVTNVVISNLTVDGNRANNIGHQAGIITGVKTNDDGRVHEAITISNVEVMNCTAYGINPHEITYNLVVENCISHNNGKDGFVADYVEGGVYRNNISYGNDRHGFNITTSSNNILLENNVAYGNGLGATGGAGIVVQRSDIFPEGEDTIPWPTQIQIGGGEYYENSREGILIKLSDHVTVTGADVHDNMRQGVRVEGATNTTLHDNTVHNNSQETNGGYDEINIRLRVDDAVDPPRIYYSEDTVVYDNLIYADGAIRSRYGIREEVTNSTVSNPSGTVVYGNTISGTLSGDVYVPPYSATDGDDYLYGTSGADSFAGLDGNDTYIVNHTGDQITEQVDKGIDLVIASLNHTLAANIEDLMLVGNAIRGTGNDLANVIVGNDKNNELEGLAGNDTLDGGLGADTMQGGDGNDIFYVDNVGDAIVEKDHAGLGGIDTAYSSVSYTLAAEVEKLFLLGIENLNATGNALENELVGNGGDNVLDGLGGADLMLGGAGDDTYIIDHTGDVVVELPGQGTDTDTVRSALSYTLGSDLENLVLTGAGGRDGTGNSLANVIVGNDGANKLHGMDGDDTIEGGLGADQLYGDAGNDIFILRKGQLSGDVMEDFTGQGTALGDSIVFSGFGAAAVLIDLGGGNWMVRDGAYEESFRIKTPVGEIAFHFSDYSFEGVAPPVNSPPTAAASGNSVSGSEDTVVSGQIPAATDAEGDAISYTQVGSLPGLTLAADGSFSFVPAANANGDFTFQYKLVDGRGAESAPQNFVISLSPVNDAPVAATTGNSASGLEGTLLTGQLPAGIDPDGGPLSYVQVGSLAGLALDANGTFSFTPPAGSSGDYSFEYKLVDALGAESAPRTVTISITPVNDAPIAAISGNTATGTEDTLLSGHIPTGFDPDGDPFNYLQVGSLAGLTLDADGTFSFAPPANANGDFTFQYKLVDASGAESAAQSFMLSLGPVNDAPVAAVTGNSATGPQNTVISGAVPAGLDVDGGPLTYTQVGTLAGLTLDGNGAFSFTPPANTSGDFVFQYKVVDAQSAESAVQNFTMTVAPAASGIVLNGTNGADTLRGTAGNDVIDGRQGGDTMYGLAGNDIFHVDSSKDKIVEAAGGGTDRVITTASFTIRADVEIDFVQATGTSAVTLKGNDWANSLSGNSAANTIAGNGGDDILDGGLGNDALTGGTGRDQFFFSTALGPNNIDAIKDFKVVDDTIILDHAIFGALSAGTLSPDSFVKGTQALDAQDHILYDSAAGKLLYDADGVGGASAVVFANISKNLPIDYLDFVVRDDLIG